AEAEFPTTYASVKDLKDKYGFEYLRRNVRLCAELGADIVKTNWPGDGDSFAKLVEAANGIPVVLAGGSRLEDAELLSRAQHFHAPLAVRDHPRAVARHPRPDACGEGAGRPRAGGPGGARVVRA